MGRSDYKTCWNCGAHADDVGELSHTRLCGKCSAERLVENVTALVRRSGPPFQVWRHRMAACVGATLVDTNEGT